MVLHANAELGLAGRLVLVRGIEQGCSLGEAAAAFSVSPATAHRWWHRWLDGGRQASALLDHSSRPRRSPRLLAPELQERICDCRRKTGWGPRLVAGATGFAHSTVWKVLHRAGISRPPPAARQPANRYEWPCPGDLLHMDVSRYARFLRPGHAVTHDRHRTAEEKRAAVGYDYGHAIVDDHSRLAYPVSEDDAPRQSKERSFMEQIVQILCALLILAAFVLAQARRVETDSLWYLVPNFVGSAGLAAYAYAGGEWGFLLLEGAWAVVSAGGVLRSAPLLRHATRA